MLGRKREIRKRREGQWETKGFGRKREFMAENSPGPDSQALENTEHLPRAANAEEFSISRNILQGFRSICLTGLPNSLWKGALATGSGNLIDRMPFLGRFPSCVLAVCRHHK